MSSVDINVMLLVLFLVGMFASGYGFGNYVEAKILEAHGKELDSLCDTINELYISLEMVYGCFTGENVTEAQAQEAVERAEALLVLVKSPDEVETA